MAIKATRRKYLATLELIRVEITEKIRDFNAVKRPVLEKSKKEVTKEDNRVNQKEKPKIVNIVK